MASTKISELTPAAALSGAELIPGVQLGSNVSITPAQIKTYIGNASETNSGLVSTGVQVIGGAKSLTGLVSLTAAGTFNTTYQLSLGTGNLKIGENGSGGEIQSFANLPLYVNPLGNNVIIGDVNTKVGIGGTPNAPLQLGNGISNRRLVIYESANNDHQYIGFGVNANVFRYQVDDIAGSHVWYAGTSPTTSDEVFRIKGTGVINIPKLPTENTTETKLLVRNSVSGDIEYRLASSLAGGDIKHQRETFFSLAISTYTIVSVTFATPFLDANYTASASVEDYAATGINAGVRVERIQNKTNAGFEVVIYNASTTSDMSGEVHAIAIHV